MVMKFPLKAARIKKSISNKNRNFCKVASINGEKIRAGLFLPNSDDFQRLIF